MPTAATTAKRCQRCYTMLPADQFGRFSRAADGLTQWCNACRGNRAARRSAGSTTRRRTTRATGFDRAFGVEFEFIGSLSTVNAALVAAGIRCQVESYGHCAPAGGGWKIVTDASVYGGGELVSPKLQGAAGFAEMRKVADILTGVASVNKTCGTHIHLDATGETLDSIRGFVKAYVSRQDAIDLLVAPSRRENGGAGRGMAARWTPAMMAELEGMTSLQTLSHTYRPDDGRRYRSVNVCSYARHGTVEVRQHQGTLNGAKVEAWVRFLMMLWTADSLTEGQDAYAVLNGMTELDSPTREYLRSRSYAFQMAGRS